LCFPEILRRSNLFICGALVDLICWHFLVVYCPRCLKMTWRFSALFFRMVLVRWRLLVGVGLLSSPRVSPPLFAGARQNPSPSPVPFLVGVCGALVHLGVPRHPLPTTDGQNPACSLPPRSESTRSFHEFGSAFSPFLLYFSTRIFSSLPLPVPILTHIISRLAHSSSRPPFCS